MAGAPRTTPIDPTDLLEDLGHFGTVASTTFEFVGARIDRLAAAAHRLRGALLWEARAHVNAAFDAMPEHPPCAFFALLMDGAFPYSDRQRWQEAASSLRKHAPDRALSITVLEALAHLADFDAAALDERRKRAALEGAHEATLAALESLGHARISNNFAAAGAAIAAHREALNLEHADPQAAAHELFARWARRANDKQAFDASTAELAKASPRDLRLAALRARCSLAWFHDAMTAQAIIEALSATGAQLTAELVALRGRAKLLHLGPAEALADLDAALAADSTIDPLDRVECLLARAAAHSASQKQLSAERDLSEAIRLAPRRADALVRRSQLRTVLVRPLDAASDLEAALQLQPLDCPESALGDLALLYFNARQYPRALPCFDRAITDATRRSTDANRRAQLEEMRGATLHFVGRFEDAVVAYSRALALSPAYGKAFSDRGEALLELGRGEAAFADLERAIELGYRQSCTFVARATYFHRKSEHDKAIVELDEAVRLAPTSAQPLELRAKCWDATGDARRANDDREKAAVLRATRR